MKKKLFFFVFFLLILHQNTIKAVTLDDIYNHLQIAFPQYENTTYNKPGSTNYLIEDKWFIQTPNSWDYTFPEYNESFKSKKTQLDTQFDLPKCETQADCSGAAICRSAQFTLDSRKLCLTKAYDFLDEVYSTITEAKHTVDIVTLGKGIISTKAFTAGLKNTLNVLAKKSVNMDHYILIRIIQGSFLPFTYNLTKKYLTDLTNQFDKKHKLIIATADVRSCFNLIMSNCGNNNDQDDVSLRFSWTHAKMVVVDNSVLITGGENFFGEDYLERNPVNDSNIKIVGSVAAGATIYANKIWEYAKNNPGFLVNKCFSYTHDYIIDECFNNFNAEKEFSLPSKVLNQNGQITKTLHSVNAMYVSKLNNNIGLPSDADQSELARVYAIRNAERTIKISQQAIFGKIYSTVNPYKFLNPISTIDGNVLESIAYAIHKNKVNTYIITSNTGMTGYGSNTDLNYIYNFIFNIMKHDFNMQEDEIKNELNNYLHLAYLSYKNAFHTMTDEEMSKVRSHNKFWMVDDKIFYTGSHNIYPSSTQEFGIIIESTESVESTLLKTFWEPMWNYAIKMPAKS